MSILDDVPDEIKLPILQSQLQQWRNTYYLHSVSVEVAQDIGDEKLEEQAKDNMVRANKAVKTLEKKVGELKRKIEKTKGE